MEVEWIQKPWATYAFKTHPEYLAEDEPADNARGRCIAFARQLNNGGWEAKIAGRGHLSFLCPDRAIAHRKLKRLVTGLA